MRATFKSLPEDPTALRAVSELMAAEIKAQAYQIEKLKKELAGHRKARFGSKSETMDQLATVFAHGVRMCQGYLIARPRAASEMRELLSAGRSPAIIRN